MKPLDGTYIFTDTKPANLEDEFYGALLCLILPGKNSGIILQSGTAAHYRVIEDGESVFTGTIGIAGADLNMPYIYLVKDTTLQIQLSSIKAWYGRGGALLTDKPIDGCDVYEMNKEDISFYGPEKAKFFVCESLSLNTAKVISKALGLDFQGEIEETKNAKNI